MAPIPIPMDAPLNAWRGRKILKESDPLLGTELLLLLSEDGGLAADPS